MTGAPRNPRSRPGRPATGPGHYLRDLVYGANDGIITTFAIVAGVTGASLPARIAVILGVANLLADGLSMGASNYLSLRSELEQTGASVAEEKPWRHGWATFGAFGVAGAVPLMAFPAHALFGWPMMFTAAALSLAALATAGAARAMFLPKRPWRAAVEMTIVGALAGAAAYGVGALTDRFIA